jgi:hyaluronan synthase
MATLVLQILDTLSIGSIYLFSFAMILVIASWLAKAVVSRQYVRFEPTWETPTVAVIIPVLGEEPEVLQNVCRRVLDQEPQKVIVVINGPRDISLESVCAKLEASNQRNFSFIWQSKPGKRYAISAALGNVREEVTVLVDSDTFWQKNTLKNLLAPFQDDGVGGVTGDQRIISPGKNILTRWSDWFELLRTSYSLPAMSVRGAVGCLPGRTIAFRTEILKRNMRRFLHDRFLGTHLEISDDRALTNYTLLDGYKTVYQDSSRVETLSPTSLSAFVRQQYRWAKGSQYNNLKMFGWMLQRKPFLCFIYSVDMLVPLLLVSNVLSWILGASFIEVSNSGDFFRALKILASNGALGLGILVMAAVAASWAVYGIRTSRVIDRSPTTFWFLPIFMLLNFFLLVPIRVAGLLTCSWDSGWGTRNLVGSAKKAKNVRERLSSIVPTVSGITLIAIFTFWGIFY